MVVVATVQVVLTTVVAMALVGGCGWDKVVMAEATGRVVVVAAVAVEEKRAGSISTAHTRPQRQAQGYDRGSTRAPYAAALVWTVTRAARATEAW